jgi:hypothetical protein
MARLLATIVFIAAFGASGAAIYTHVQHDGLGTFVHRLGFNQNGKSAAEDALLSAGTQLANDHQAFGTYRRTNVTRFSKMQLAWATDDAYCVQLQKGGQWYHMTGPEGVPQNGTC